MEISAISFNDSTQRRHRSCETHSLQAFSGLVWPPQQGNAQENGRLIFTPIIAKGDQQLHPLFSSAIAAGDTKAPLPFGRMVKWDLVGGGSTI
ncbi:hypothetical protein ACJ73_03315 [Blastomyces percursus]|uniref:Uncharacterized protein n=1 Tax=Blastomyces percursus TaxID=1658174 RepID=A0A1J9Q9X7_9EURO|nr:hypothetical protein ACJ73_03315 [Blastomyces percursus]